LGNDQQVIESYTVEVDTPDDSFNSGIFFGITRSTTDIRSLSPSGQGLVADDVTFTSPVPEPEVYTMLLSGLGLMGWVARRRNKKTMLERGTGCVNAMTSGPNTKRPDPPAAILPAPLPRHYSVSRIHIFQTHLPTHRARLPQ
jgi:hypothetical protein